jgi:Raf kinase inhibitor-like YbhB/YbcL family protein
MSYRRRSAGAVARALALVLAVAGAAGCDTGDGRTLEEPAPGATAPPHVTSTTAPPSVELEPPVGSDEAAAVTLTSPAYREGTAIPARQSCDGEELSPPLSWTSAPSGTAELALTAVDPDTPAGPFVHWLVTGIDPVVTGVGEGGVPESAVEVQPWIGPCPPRGETHDYVITLYLLSSPSGIGVETSAEDALAALESTPGPTATLTGTYGRA